MSSRVVDSKEGKLDVDAGRKKSVEAAVDILKSLDQSESWFDLKQIKCIVTSGGGFMTDAYDLFIISLITKLIGRVYYPDIRYYPPAYCTANNIPNFQYQGTTAWVNHGCGKSWGSKFSWNGVSYASQNDWLNQTYGPGPNPSTWTVHMALQHAPSDMPTNINFSLQAVALIGAIAGQLTFGRLGDLVGRKLMQSATLVRP